MIQVPYTLRDRKVNSEIHKMANSWLHEDTGLLQDAEERKVTRLWEPYLRKASAMEVKWTMNRPGIVRNSTLYVVPTNFPRISFLDLAEFSFDGQALVREVTDYSYTWKLKRLEDTYSLECIQRNHFYADIFMYIEIQYMKRAQEKIFKDCQLYIETLEVNENMPFWNSSTKYSTAMLVMYEKIKFSQTQKLIKEIQDSRIIVHYFEKLCSNGVYSRIFFDMVEGPYMEMIFAHFSRAGSNARTFFGKICRRLKCFRYDSPVQVALAKKNFRSYLNRIMKIKCPFIVSWMKSDYPPNDDILWPLLGVYGAPQAYFHSHEFRNRLLYDMMIAVALEENSKEVLDIIASNIRIVWRAIPAPFLRSTDLKDCFESFMVDTQYNVLGSTYSFETPTTSRWNTFKSIFPVDCLAETYQPRSLKHLSRCAVRQNMYNAPTEFPFRYLPKDLKKYLWLEL